MIDNKLEQILFLTCNSLINHNMSSSNLLSYISYSTIYNNVKYDMKNIFQEPDSFSTVIVMGIREGFDEVFNFCLTILSELGFIIHSYTNQGSQSNTGSNQICFYWLGIKGFVMKYLSIESIENYKNNNQNVDDQYSLEQKIQLFTNSFMVRLILKVYTYIDSEITSQMTFEYKLHGYENQVDKIIASLLFLELISSQGRTAVLNYKLFNHSSKGLVNEENLFEEREKRSIFTKTDEFCIIYNKVLLEKINYWKVLFDSNVKAEIDEMKMEKKGKGNVEARNMTEISKNLKIKYMKSQMTKNKSNNINMNSTSNMNPTQTQNDHKNSNQIDINNSQNYNSIQQDSFQKQYLTTIETLKKETVQKNKFSEQMLTREDNLKNSLNQSGFAFIKGSNWKFYMKGLICIIGRTGNMNIPQGMNTRKLKWEVDLNLGEGKRISRQHAVIVFNFHSQCFDIINISKKYTIKVNGDDLFSGETYVLSSRSIISIGKEVFVFYLPLDC